MTDQVPANICISVVSHRHGAQLYQLITQLDAVCHDSVTQVVVTLNVSEPDLLALLRARRWSFILTLVENIQPCGFGANHNAAFKYCISPYFCVLNPDIDFVDNPFPVLMAGLRGTQAGCAFPVQLDTEGRLQDYARQLPTPKALLLRYLAKLRHHQQADPVLYLDWVNGAFMLYPAPVFKRLGGFDERFFMYCEDVDICLRLQLAGYRLVQTSAEVVHAAHRSSRVNLRYLIWHVWSLGRLWFSAPYHAYLLRRSGL
ncbi:MAG: glycosyltransferase family 2 protein [Chitinophagaceae bacterium]|nr:glycosyltransferase family 2 protein [Polaromonas sp.]